jgi:hypothetical protein
MKSFIIGEITPCGPLKVNRSFGGQISSIFRVEELGKQGTSMKALLATCLDAGLLFELFFGPEEGGDKFLRNVG